MCHVVDYSVLDNRRVKITENEKTEITGSYQKMKKETFEHSGDDDTNFNWCTWKVPKKLKRRMK